MNRVSFIFIIAIIFCLSGCNLFSNSGDFNKYNFVIDCTAGQLNNLINQKDIRTNNIVLLGTLNAKDFRFMKTSLTMLEYIDLRNATIVEYSGDEGTFENLNSFYNANEIPSEAFSPRTPAEPGMHLLNEVLLPDNLTAIRSSAFSSVVNLRTIEIPEGVTLVDFVSFAADTNLVSVHFPGTLLNVGSRAFYNCIKLQTIYINAKNPPAMEQDAFESDYLNRKPFHATLIVPGGAKSAYEKSDWKIFTRIKEKN